MYCNLFNSHRSIKISLTQNSQIESKNSNDSYRSKNLIKLKNLIDECFQTDQDTSNLNDVKERVYLVQNSDLANESVKNIETTHEVMYASNLSRLATIIY